MVLLSSNGWCNLLEFYFTSIVVAAVNKAVQSIGVFLVRYKHVSQGIDKSNVRVFTILS